MGADLSSINSYTEKQLTRHYNTLSEENKHDAASRQILDNVGEEYTSYEKRPANPSQHDSIFQSITCAEYADWWAHFTRANKYECIKANKLETTAEMLRK